MQIKPNEGSRESKKKYVEILDPDLKILDNEIHKNNSNGQSESS
jgi:hypothetical protein